MRSRARTRGLIALVLAISAAAQAVAQSGVPAGTSGGGREISDSGDLAQAFEIALGLESGMRARHFVKRAFALLGRQGVAKDDAEFKRINDTLDEIRYSLDPTKREAGRRQLDGDLQKLKAELLSLLPPVSAFDTPDDDGTGMIVLWRPVAGASKYMLEGREVRTPGSTDAPWKPLKELGASAFSDTKPMKIYSGRQYQFRVSSVSAEGAASVAGETQLVTAKRNWFNWNKTYYLIFVAILCVSVVFYVWLAQRGVQLNIRKIAGLEAIDEAVGRATEMGRPVLFIAGIQDMDNIQTIAGLTILGRVARTAAEHDAMLEVPTSRSLVMTAARETVHTAFMNAGRPDAYNEKKIYYVTDEQFGFVAATTGMIVREKPAACIYMGAFFAESLILAETANTVGSIQIAGTAEPAQLPFFVAACDYTLIGEEFYAASAYLSGEPRQLGSLKGQDVGKAIVMIITMFAAVLFTIAVLTKSENSFLGDILDFLRESVLRVAA